MKAAEGRIGNASMAEMTPGENVSLTQFRFYPPLNEITVSTVLLPFLILSPISATDQSVRSDSHRH